MHIITIYTVVYQHNVKPTQCPDIHLIIHAWSRVCCLIQLKSGGRNNVEGFLALAPITTADNVAPAKDSILQVELFAVGMLLNNHAHHQNTGAS